VTLQNSSQDWLQPVAADVETALRGEPGCTRDQLGRACRKRFFASRVFLAASNGVKMGQPWASIGGGKLAGSILD
jgi:hypothetical protein